jgi:hypothetical protein
MEISNNGKLLQIRQYGDLILIDTSFVYEAIITKKTNGATITGGNAILYYTFDEKRETNLSFNSEEELRSFIMAYSIAKNGGKN